MCHYTEPCSWSSAENVLFEIMYRNVHRILSTIQHQYGNNLWVLISTFFQIKQNIFFYIGPPKEDIFLDHLLWSIFQSVLHITYYKLPAGPLRAASENDQRWCHAPIVIPWINSFQLNNATFQHQLAPRVLSHHDCINLKLYYLQKYIN